MTLFVILLVSAAILAGYLTAGYKMGLKASVRYLEGQREEYPILYKNATPDTDITLREGAIGTVFLWTFFWPIVAVFGMATGAIGEQVIDLDPLSTKQRIAEQEEKIAELERELGIKE